MNEDGLDLGHLEAHSHCSVDDAMENAKVWSLVLENEPLLSVLHQQTLLLLVGRHAYGPDARRVVVGGMGVLWEVLRVVRGELVVDGDRGSLWSTRSRVGSESKSWRSI